MGNSMSAPKVNVDKILKDRKLVLYVDLDETLVWSNRIRTKEERAHYAAMKDQDVHFIVIRREGHRPQVQATMVRPGAYKFLQEMSTMYEMHVATTGTNEYGKEVVKILDPKQNLFQPKIFSKEFFEESKDTKGFVIEEMFDKMEQPPAVAIDDKEKVWGQQKDHVMPVMKFRGEEQDSKYLECLAIFLREVHEEYFKRMDQMQLEKSEKKYPDTCAVLKDVKSIWAEKANATS